MKRLIIFWCIVIFLSSAAFAISADISEICIGARPLALGSAFVGLSNDSSGIFVNPAGIEKKKGILFLSSYGKLLEDVAYSGLGISWPFMGGRVGVGYSNAQVDDIPITTLTQTATQLVVSQTGVTGYSSSIFNLFYSLKVLKDISTGLNLKLYTQGFSYNQGALENAHGSGFDLDLSSKWKIDRNLSLGIVLKNVLPTTMGGKFVWEKNKKEEGIPAVFLAGLSYKTKIASQKINFLLDSEYRPTTTKKTLFKAGIEWWPFSYFCLRGGINQVDSNTEIQNNASLGIGFYFAGFSFDFAYRKFGQIDQNNTYFFSIGYSEPERFALAPPPSKKKIRIFEPEVKEKPILKEFIDVSEDHWAREPIEYLATMGIMRGYPDETFKPEKPLTRAELATLLVKAKKFEIKKTTKKLAPDLPKDHWASPYIEVALKRKYLAGYPDGTFKPNKEVTRTEAVIIFSRFSGLALKKKIESKPFPDVSVNHWAAPAISAAKVNGLLEYLSGKKFEGDKFLTRAEAAEILSKTPFGKEKIKEFLEK